MRRPSAPLIAFAAAVGSLTGLRAIAGFDFPDIAPLLGFDTLPRELLGISWTARASWPADAQTVALARLVGTVCALGLAAVLIATLNALILLAEASAARRGELAIRAALGASPGRLVMRLLRELRTLMAGGLALGLVLGMSGGALLRLTWPGSLVGLASVPGGLAAALPGDLIAALSCVIVLLCLAHLSTAWQVTRKGRAVASLRSGGRAGVDPFSVFIRNALAATHVALAATIVVAAIGLAGAVAPAGDAAEARGAATAGSAAMTGSAAMVGNAAEGPYVLSVVHGDPANADWSAVLATIAQIDGIEAESLSAPGALVGLGIRDVAIAECGACSRGGLPAPLWNARADHHVVAPGYFGFAGVSLLEGRDFTPADAVGSLPVAIVNRTFANTAFEGGRPIGKRIRIGTDFDAWYTVVGIVDDPPRMTLGADGLAREEVYLSALQRPPIHADVILRTDFDAAESVAHALAAFGLEVSAPRAITEYRDDLAAPLRWSRNVVTVFAVLASLLGLHGLVLIAIQTTRRLKPALAVRRAVGASDRQIVWHVLATRLRVTAWGLAGVAFLGTMASAPIQSVSGGSGPALLTWIGIAMTVMAVALTASSRAAGEALAAEPRSLLD